MGTMDYMGATLACPTKHQGVVRGSGFGFYTVVPGGFHTGTIGVLYELQNP